VTRLMGDATHVNVPQLASAPGLQVAAGYVTGTPDILWTAADWARFAGISQVTIDQGGVGSPVASAVVRDVEAGAWTVANAVNRDRWTASRPTIYCSLSTVPTLASAGWSGDVWVANWTSTPPSSPPATPGMNCVAVQYTNQGGGGAYDLSIVFDPAWPTGEFMNGTGQLIIWGATGSAYLLSGGRMHHIQDIDALNLYTAAGVNQAGSAGGAHVSAAEEAALLADFPPGNPAVTVTATAPTFNIAGTATPAA
jgi:hypothetical protein